MDQGAERTRMAEADDGRARWRQWGPYLAERAWGTVREDYSADGDAWSYLPRDVAASTAYRWNEEGMAGLCDDEQFLCFAPALWNGADPFLKERMFGLSNSEGNHGEDVKERYWYADATPTASWLQWRYQYPVSAFPYEELLAQNRSRSRAQPEYEIEDTDCFATGFWDVTVEVGKAGPGDIHWRLTARNRSASAATLHVLPTLWFRNTWAWGRDARRPSIGPDSGSLVAEHHKLGRLTVTYDGDPVQLFCDNDTNTERRYGIPGPAYPKDGINDHVISGAATVNPACTGTKAALWYRLTVPAGQTGTVTLRLHGDSDPPGRFDPAVLEARRAEADRFHESLAAGLAAADAPVVRQALAGMVWSQCFYHFNVARWLDGDPGQPPPPPERGELRNGGWRHVDAREVFLMPDAWEYPWFAAWDLAFHAVAYAHADPRAAKNQLVLLAREWLMHANGQLPAYEWNFSDLNPPVHAWAALEVFHITGEEDLHFLARVFHKLLVNFTWWVNRVDAQGNNLFEGGFLGMDNIGPFNRSQPPPLAGQLEQSDGTAWMAVYCLDLLRMSLHLALADRSYEDMAVKFFEHFTQIAAAMNEGLWDEGDGFFYDTLRMPDGATTPFRVRSVAGLVSLAACRVVGAETLAALPEFAARVEWFLAHRLDVCDRVVARRPDGSMLLSVLTGDRLRSVLRRTFDPAEFYSPHGVRSVSAWHRDHPYEDTVSGTPIGPVDYEPAESSTGLFGGNSNWRGPVWMPVNHLIVTGLRRLASFYGSDITVTLPDGRSASLAAAGDDLAGRLKSLFLAGPDGRIPAAGGRDWPDGLRWFHEYFDGDTGRGLGASHQTGWTALVADLALRGGRDLG
ncbi:MAG TPA: hypothetical protein VFP54_09210 [Acidimicrobiales bacterium]|nr:hypothetical protein [Acidimicrobiales bacterium]